MHCMAPMAMCGLLADGYRQGRPRKGVQVLRNEVDLGRQLANSLDP